MPLTRGGYVGSVALAYLRRSREPGSCVNELGPEGAKRVRIEGVLESDD
jgi:hypothetical protein